MRRWLQGLFVLTALTVVAPFMAPEVLAFPYQQNFGTDRVWSTSPIPRTRMAAILADANARTLTSPLARKTEPRRIFLTGGGWRWRVLVFQFPGAFAVTRSFREDLILNRTDVPTNTIYNRRGTGRTRTIAGVIAHEKCHGMERNHFGRWVDLTKPTWLREGYCDYVAQESTLTGSEAAELKRTGKSDPALVYFEGRARVAAILDANGGNIDRLFADAH